MSRETPDVQCLTWTSDCRRNDFHMGWDKTVPSSKLPKWEGLQCLKFSYLCVTCGKLTGGTRSATPSIPFEFLLSLISGEPEFGVKKEAVAEWPPLAWEASLWPKVLRHHAFKFVSILSLYKLWWWLWTSGMELGFNPGDSVEPINEEFKRMESLTEEDSYTVSLDW